MERNSREKENKREQTNLWVFIVSETLMYTTAVLQKKSSFKHSSTPPPFLFICLSLPAFLSFCLIDVSDGETGFLAFCSFREELRGGQGVTLGKVTDEGAAEEDGGEVALKKGGAGKIYHRVKKTL